MGQQSRFRHCGKTLQNQPLEQATAGHCGEPAAPGQIRGQGFSGGANPVDLQFLGQVQQAVQDNGNQVNVLMAIKADPLFSGELSIAIDLAANTAFQLRTDPLPATRQQGGQQQLPETGR